MSITSVEREYVYVLYGLCFSVYLFMRLFFNKHKEKCFLLCNRRLEVYYDQIKNKEKHHFVLDILFCCTILLTYIQSADPMVMILLITIRIVIVVNLIFSIFPVIILSLIYLCCRDEPILHMISVFSGYKFREFAQRLSEQNNIPDTSAEQRNALINQLPTDFYKNTDASHTDCSICLSEFCEEDCVRILKCTHYFHEQCINLWLQDNDTCPLCRINVIADEEKSSESPESPESASDESEEINDVP